MRSRGFIGIRCSSKHPLPAHFEACPKSPARRISCFFWFHYKNAAASFYKWSSMQMREEWNPGVDNNIYVRREVKSNALAWIKDRASVQPIHFPTYRSILIFLLNADSGQWINEMIQKPLFIFLILKCKMIADKDKQTMAIMLITSTDP